MITYKVTVDDYATRWYLDGKLHRVGGPAVEDANGYKSWWLDDKRHRVGGPAVEYTDGTKEWWLDDKCHRIEGPAIEYTDGTKEWWLDGERLTEEEHTKQTPGCAGKTVEIDGVEYLLVRR